MTVIDACQEVGMPRSTFYYIIHREADAITEFQTIIERSEREQLAVILYSKVQILEKIIEDGLAEKTKPRDRIAIHKMLTELIDTLMARLNATRTDTTSIKELMTGPTLKMGVSRFNGVEMVANADSSGVPPGMDIQEEEGWS